jgi:uncharacterized protein (DUF58 family)
MFSRNSIYITIEGWCYLAVFFLVFLGAMTREANLLLVLAGLLLGPLVFNIQAALVTLNGLEVRRKLPLGVCAGDLLVVNLSVSNARRRLGSWAVVVGDVLCHESKLAGEAPVLTNVLFPYVPAGQMCKGVYRGRLVRRGRYRFGPMQVSTRFPFGLFCRVVNTQAIDTLTVFPKLGYLTEHWTTRQHEAFAGTHRREQRPGPEGDFHGLRPWRAGDSRRWIHWRSYARGGNLVVRQFEQPRNRDVAVLLDLWQDANPSPQNDEHVELAVSFAATALADLCRKGGSTLHLGISDPLPQCTSGQVSLALLQDMMHRLAVVEPQPSDHLKDLLEHVTGKLEQGTEIILLSVRKVDFADSRRFGSFFADPSRRNLPRGIRCIDTSSGELEQYFYIE